MMIGKIRITQIDIILMFIRTNNLGNGETGLEILRTQKLVEMIMLFRILYTQLQIKMVAQRVVI
jgi:hypothetical protein